MPVPVTDSEHSIITRLGFGGGGRHISLLANHFSVSIDVPDASFHLYNVSITLDGKPVKGKCTGRMILDKLRQTQRLLFSGRPCAYDGGNNLYSLDHLPWNLSESTVVMDESSFKLNAGNRNKTSKRLKPEPKVFKVDITYVSTMPVKSLLSCRGEHANQSFCDARIILDAVLCQQASRRGCLLIRQSFFENDASNFSDVGGGVIACKGLYSSFSATLAGLSLNIDVSHTLLLKPGPVIEFLLANQNVNDTRYINWDNAGKTLKNLRIKAAHLGTIFKVFGLSKKPCFQQLFCLKEKNIENAAGRERITEVTVLDYFTNHRGIKLTRSVYMPCLDVGKLNRPTYLPLELCELVPLQHYKTPLSTVQRASFIEKIRQKPQEKIRTVTDALRSSSYQEDPFISACGITISPQMTQVDGRIIQAPRLQIGKNEDFIPCGGRWSFRNKQPLRPVSIKRWAVVNFSVPCDTSRISRELINSAIMKGIFMERPYALVEEDSRDKSSDPVLRVDRMFEQLVEKLPGLPEFLLCVLPDRKCSDIYGPWKKKTLSDLGVITQCISPSKITDNYLSNLLLKINSKIGGINSLIAMEHICCTPSMIINPTMIIGMVLSRGSPPRTGIPCIATAVGSRSWPLVSSYKAASRAQCSNQEVMECLFELSDEGNDSGMIRELLLEFYRSTNGKKPTQIIVFRDGVSEMQFGRVLETELNQILKAYDHLDGTHVPKFTVIATHRSHRTRLFLEGSSQNVPPGTVVDRNIVHPRYYDFYMCPHLGVLGTSRPTHYTVLIDEIVFSPDELQQFVHSLSYGYESSTSAIADVAPVRYARRASSQMRQLIDNNEDIPKLHKNVHSSMFFA